MKNICFLGIDLGGTNFKYAVLDKEQRIKEYKVKPIAGWEEPEKALAFVEALFRKLAGKYNLLSLGFGLPGLVDYQKGYIHYLVNLKKWRNIEWKQILESKLQLAVFLDNDVNVATLAEYYLGAGYGCRNMLMLALGTGVGGGLILAGKIYRGKNNLAGEAGHIPLGLRGPSCNCGGRACLESYIGNRRLLRKAKTLAKKNPDSFLARRWSEKGRIDLEDVTSGARRGEKLCIEFWKEVAEKLGMVVVGIVNLLNPERVIIGGGISNAGRYLFQPLREFVSGRAMEIQAKNVEILPPKLKDGAGAIGAALLAEFALEGKDF